MIKVGIIGASGMAGRTIYKLAAATQDLNPIGIVRHEKKAKEVLGDDAQLLSGDIFAMTDSLLSRFDVIIDAFGTNPADADRHLQLDQYAAPAVKGAPVPGNDHGCRLGRDFASGNV